jgi:hypothetical protein
MARRSASVSRQSAALATSRATASRAPLARETNRDLVQRQEIERTMALISAQRAVGRGGSVAEAFGRVRAGQFEGDMMRVAERQSGGGRLTTRRANGSDPFSSMRGSGSSSGSSGSSGGGSTSGSGSGSGSVGSGSSGGGGEGRGGAAGSARGGTGRPGGL